MKAGEEKEEEEGEGEPERKWLEAAGFEHLVKEYENGKEVKEDLVNQETSSLTRTQAAAVKRRINSLNTTLRRRREQTTSTVSASPTDDLGGPFDRLSDSKLSPGDALRARDVAARPDVRHVFSEDGTGYHQHHHLTASVSSSSFPPGPTLSSSHHPPSPSGSPSSAGFRRGGALESLGGLPFLQNKTGHYAVNQNGRTPQQSASSASYSHSNGVDGIQTLSLTPTGTTPRCRVHAIGGAASPSAAEVFSRETRTISPPASSLAAASDVCCRVEDVGPIADVAEQDSPEKTPDAKLEFGYASPSTKKPSIMSDASTNVSPPSVSPPTAVASTASTSQRTVAAAAIPAPSSHRQSPQTSPPSALPASSEDDLPNFVLVRDELGVTQIGDLSVHDLSRIRSLALIELTALFDVLDIQFVKRKPLKPRGLPKPGEAPFSIFHVPLSWLLENDQRLSSPMIRVPLVFDRILSHLEASGLREEGILRIPGAAARIKQIRSDLETHFYSSPQHPSKIFDQVRTTDLAALSKQFLRELPQPLLTNEWVEAFASVERVPDRKQQLQALNLLILLLPNVHRDSLKRLLMFLNKVVANQEFNKMSLTNVATIMAPNLFLQPKSRKQLRVKENEVNMAKGTTNVVKMLIKYHDILWTVPSFMVTQIRHQIEMEALKKSSRGDSDGGKHSCHNLHLMRWLGVKKSRGGSTKTNASSSSGSSSSGAGTVIQASLAGQGVVHATSAQTGTSISSSGLLQIPGGGGGGGAPSPGPLPPRHPPPSPAQRSNASSGYSPATASYRGDVSSASTRAAFDPSTDASTTPSAPATAASSFDDAEDLDSLTSSASTGAVNEGMILVRTGRPLSRASTQFQLDDRTTAGDLVQLFSRLHGFRDGRVPSESLDALLNPACRGPALAGGAGGSVAATAAKTSLALLPPGMSKLHSSLLLLDDITALHLFEYGGNVGWRCLDPGTNMMALVRVNPGAKWIIQTRISPFVGKSV